MKSKIEKNIDIEEFKREYANPKLSISDEYPILSMEVGDSFFLPKKDCNTKVKTRIYTCGYYNEMKLSILKCDGGARVFRIK